MRGVFKRGVFKRGAFKRGAFKGGALLACCAVILVALPLAGFAKQTAAADKPPVPLLWKVSDADNSVYLLGSFHLLKPGDYPLSADVDAAFDDAESLMFEMSPEEMESPTLATQMVQAAMRSDGTTLDSDLSPETNRKLQAWLDAQEGQGVMLSSAMLQPFEPWFVALTIGMTEMTRAGLDPALGLDRHFAEAAQAAGKPTAGFETSAQQIAFLDGMGHAEQLQFLRETLDDAAQGGEEIEKLHKRWRSGDVEGMWTGLGADMRRDYPQLYQHINVERNDAWLPKIVQLLEAPGTDDTLVVVGSLHLLGSDGLVEKLRAKGYKVERICSACKR